MGHSEFRFLCDLLLAPVPLAVLTTQSLQEHFLCVFEPLPEVIGMAIYEDSALIFGRFCPDEEAHIVIPEASSGALWLNFYSGCREHRRESR